MKFSIEHCLSKNEQIYKKLRTYSHLQNKYFSYN